MSTVPTASTSTSDVNKIYGTYRVQVKCVSSDDVDGNTCVDYYVAWIPRTVYSTYGEYDFAAPRGWAHDYKPEELKVDVGPDLKYPTYTRIQGPTQRSVIQALRCIFSGVVGEKESKPATGFKTTFVRHFTFRVRQDPDATSSASGESIAPLFQDESDDDFW
jgi:hypothetical protein